MLRLALCDCSPQGSSAPVAGGGLPHGPGSAAGEERLGAFTRGLPRRSEDRAQRQVLRGTVDARHRARQRRRRSPHAFRKGVISGLRKAGAAPDAVEFLVGHTFGSVGVYTDPDGLPLAEAVDMVPEVPEGLYRDEVFAAEVVVLDRRR